MQRSRFRVIAALIFLVVLQHMATAQVFEWEKQGSAFNAVQRATVINPIAYTGPQPFDMIHYDLDLHFAMATADMGGTVTMILIPRASFKSLTLNEVQLQLDSIAVNGVPVMSGVTYSGETFTIPLPFQTTAGETLSVSIRYHRPPGLSRDSNRQGYYYFVPDTLGLQNLPDTLGYTMSEPSDARFWLPCYDEPWDKATLELRARVPAGYTAASNGKFVGTTANTDGTVTWHWREDHQIATYLMAVTISKWRVITLPFERSPGDTVPVQYYVWRDDSLDCANHLPTVVRMIQNLSHFFGPYPFDKYGMTGVTPFNYGGMEHQTITTLHRAYVTYDPVVVHELGHQWWGDDVTCGTWEDIWLNESFASYAEALWQESLSGPAALRAYMTSSFEDFAYGSWQGTIYDPVDQGFGYFPISVYSKGAWVLHMLRGMVGDSSFFGSLRSYRTRYHGAAAITDEFRAVVDSVSKTNTEWFFDEWIYGRGWPKYEIAMQYALGQANFTVFQRQDTTWQTFRMPIQVRAAGEGKDTTFVILDSLRVQSFAQALSFTPDSIVLDPDNWVLKQIVSAPTSVSPASSALPARVTLEQNYPNPFNPTTVVSGQLTADSWVKLEVYDLLGRKVSTLADGRLRAGRFAFVFDARGLASGVYFCRMTAGSLTQVRAMTLAR